MRLSQFEQNAIKTLSKKIYGDDSRVIIFGSRVDDAKKGGDIDIFIETVKEKDLDDKIKFLVSLEEQIGEQKIDLIVKTPSSKQKDIFEIAKKSGVEL